MMNNTLENKAKELEKAARRVTYLANIYSQVEERMQWNTMIYHSSDEEHEESWFTAPEPDDYQYDEYNVWLEVLKAIEKLAK